ncbi:hypothetical protein [Beijerinckia sp. L45]|uniref:hypothetical protein n=1 Tax=Beijerinckia sp. L45 TaxID=1641855 RepID=UPI00131C13A0|nr:hypothetical protein [Beijerinckia sp. L45]
MSVSNKESDALTIALQMREAIGYLAALASKSELDKIARKLLGVHLDLGAKIESLIEQQNAENAKPGKSPLIRH